MAEENTTVANYNNIVNTSNPPNMPSVEGPSVLAVYTGGVIMLVTMLCGLLGNIFIFLTILKTDAKKSTINILIAVICIIDVINLSFNVSKLFISNIFENWSSNHLCKLYSHITVFILGTSLWYTALIAIHRCIIAFSNRIYMTISKKYFVFFQVIFPYALLFLFLINLDFENFYYYEPKILFCLVKKEFGLVRNLMFVVFIIVPSTIIIICYIAIFIKVYIGSAATQANHNTMWLRRKTEITKMLGIVFFKIFIGYFPYGSILIMVRQLDYISNVYVVFNVLNAVISSLNLIIYGVMDRQMNQACRQFLSSFKRQVPVNVHAPVAPNEGPTSDDEL